MPDVTETLGELLTGLGFRVRTASSGEEALRLIHDQRPDAVVSDIEMPGIGGLGLAQALRADQTDTPVLIAVSGSPQSLRQAAEVFDHTLPKPISLTALEELLDRVP